MGTPNATWRKASIYDWVGLFIREQIERGFDLSATILDVGAGWGKYKFLLYPYPMDACEIWEPNVTEHNLRGLYRTVYVADICDLSLPYYDVLIFGDVFEHIDRARAKRLLEKVWDRCAQLYIAVPFEYEQGAVDGNPYEVHAQADLTPELMAREYPQLRLLKAQDGRGVYAKA